MLTISSLPVGNLSEINKLNIEDSNVIIYLIMDDRTIGKARLIYEDMFCLTDFKILSKYDNEYNQLFFFRGIVFKLGTVNEKLKVLSDDRLLKYGFTKKDKYMTINCSEAEYPSLCKNNKEDK